MPKLNWKVPAILAALLLAFALFGSWWEYSHKPAKEEAERSTKKMFAAVESARIDTVRLVDGAREFALKCQDAAKDLCKPGDQSAWLLTSPRQLRADDANANSLLSTLKNFAAAEVIDLSKETPEKRAMILSGYGLDAKARQAAGFKRIELKFQDAQKNEKTVVGYFGETHPVGGQIFAGLAEGGAFNEKQVFIVPAYLSSNFDKDLTYWREKKLLSLTPPDVAAFEFKGSKTSFKAVKKDGAWTMKAALTGDVPGDTENIESLLSTVAYLKAKDFASDDKRDAKARKELAGARRLLTLTLQPVEAPAAPKPDAKDAKTESKDAKAVAQAEPAKTTPPEPITLTFLEKKGTKKKSAKKDPKAPKTAETEGDRLFIEVSNLDPLFEVTAGTKDNVDKELKHFRLSKLLTSMDRFTAKRLEFTGKPLGDAPLGFKKDDSDWKFEKRKEELDQDKVQQLLDRLSGNRIKDFLTGAKIPTGQDQGLILSLGTEKEPGKVSLVFWRKPNDTANQLFARDLKSDRKEIYEIDPMVRDALPWDISFFDKKKVAPPAPGPGPEAGPGGPPGFDQAKGMPMGAPGQPPPLTPPPPPPGKK